MTSVRLGGPNPAPEGTPTTDPSGDATAPGQNGAAGRGGRGGRGGGEPWSDGGRYPPPAATIDPDPTRSWLRRVLPVVGAHRRIFAISLVASFVGLVIQNVIPLVTKEAIDQALDPTAAARPLEPFIVLLALLAVARAAIGYVSRRFLFETAYDIEFDLRTIVYEHLSRLSFSFYDRVQSGQLISRANSDIRSVQMYLAFAPSILVQCTSAVIAFAIMLTIDVRLALVAMAVMPLVYAVGARMRDLMFPISWVVQSRTADVATVVDENINGVRVVKSFAAEESQIGLLTRAARRLQWATVRQVDIRARWAPVLENLPRVGQALILLYGGWQAIEGRVSVGALVAFFTYVVQLQQPFRLLGMLMMMGQRAAASAARIYEVLDERPAVLDRPGAVDLTGCRGDVRFESVGFSYAGGPPVLDGFELHLRPGDTVAMVGRTGSGKSTVARLMTRFYDVTAGAVRVDGLDVRDVTQESLRAQIGVVLDEPFLFSVSVRDNIAYGRPGANMAEVEAAARAAGAHDFIERLAQGYDTVVGERGYTLSGGQRQRIAIARTLLVNPPVLILDDATSAIDVQVEHEIHGALRELMRGRTTLIIAHRLSTISLADRVVLLDGGRIVAEGTHADLLANVPLYAEVLAQAEAAEVLATDEPSHRPDGAERPGPVTPGVSLDGGLTFPGGDL